MCIQDWQIGRLIRSAASRFICNGSGNQEMLRRNKDRVAVSFAATGVDIIWIRPGPSVGSNDMFPLVTVVSNSIGLDTLTTIDYYTHHFTTKDHGDLPALDWVASGAASAEILIVEYFLPEDVLYLTPEELRKRAK
jgi:hypothetical protein